VRLPQLPEGRQPVTGLTIEELTRLLGSRVRALATLRWLVERPLPAALPERIEGVAAAPWNDLRAAAGLPAWRVAARAVAADGTIK
jgi:hypothetical protein